MPFVTRCGEVARLIASERAVHEGCGPESFGATEIPGEPSVGARRSAW